MKFALVFLLVACGKEKPVVREEPVPLPTVTAQIATVATETFGPPVPPPVAVAESRPESKQFAPRAVPRRARVHRKSGPVNFLANPYPGPIAVELSAPLSRLFSARAESAPMVEVAEQKLVHCLPREECEPPPTFAFAHSVPPFDARVSFGGEEKRQNEIYWRWIKDGEPSRPCTPAEAAEGFSFGYACRVRVGEVLYVTQRFRVTMEEE
jgi:hypothetical protein